MKLNHWLFLSVIGIIVVGSSIFIFNANDSSVAKNEIETEISGTNEVNDSETEVETFYNDEIAQIIVAEEEAVENAKVYVQGDTVYVELELSDTATDETISELTDRLNVKVKENYEEEKVNVIAKKSEETVANITIEKDGSKTENPKDNTETNNSNEEVGGEEKMTALNTLGEGFRIDDNTAFGSWGVSLYLSKLPKELKDVQEFTLEVAGERFNFEINKFDADVRTAQIPESFTEEQVQNAKVIY